MKKAANRGGLLLWRQPSLRYRACNDVPLNPFALLAMEGSQVLARFARLNCRQFHWRAAGGALRPFVLRVEHRSLSNTDRNRVSLARAMGWNAIAPRLSVALPSQCGHT